MLKAACSPSPSPSSARSSAGRICPPPCRYSMGSLPTLVSITWPLPRRTRYSSETTRPPSTRMSPPRGKLGMRPRVGNPGEARMRRAAEPIRQTSQRPGSGRAHQVEQGPERGQQGGRDAEALRAEEKQRVRGVAQGEEEDGREQAAGRGGGRERGRDRGRRRGGRRGGARRFSDCE